MKGESAEADRGGFAPTMRIGKVSHEIDYLALVSLPCWYCNQMAHFIVEFPASGGIVYC